jgi:NAD-dependent dihydropyrimidine dehydrogenase PreA subunit
MDQPIRILYCNCAYSKVIPPEVKQEVLARLSASGVAFQATADLCGLAARKDPALQRIAESGRLRIAACFPRAVRWLFHAAGNPLPEDGVEVLNMRELSVEEVVSRLVTEETRVPAGQASEAEMQAELIGEGTCACQSGTWIPWFPVIDYDRCGNCKQCLSFCLFGVFGLDGEGQIEVGNPAACKTDCPACARVCPNVAIMFPKYGKSPINGNEVHKEDMEHEVVKVDAAALFREGVLEALRARGADAGNRFSTSEGDSIPAGLCEQCAGLMGLDPETARAAMAGVSGAGDGGNEDADGEVAGQEADSSAAGSQCPCSSSRDWDI